MQSKFMAAINQLAAEKNLPKERVVEIVCHALRAAYRKDYGNRDQNLEVTLDEDTAQATVYVIKEVVEAYDEEDKGAEEHQILVADAKKYKKDAKVGDEIRIDVTPADYGRIAAQSAKQVIIQRIQEAEKDIITEMYKGREHEILNGYVNRIEGPNVYIDLDRTQAILRPQDRIPREDYHNGQRIKVYLDKVVSTPKGPRLLISRTHPKLVNCLLELEIPEVREGVVEVKAVAREPGVRTKVAVFSSDANVDPIGACVGQKGVRIQSIMEEFNGERIDIIEFSEDILQMLNASLAPAKISYIELDEENKRASVYVPVEERALAIGKGGQNVRLASMLNGWEIDIVDLDKLDTSKLDQLKKQEVEKSLKPSKGEKQEKAKVEMPVAAEDIKDLPGITEAVVKKLETAGFVKSIQLMGLNAEALTAIEGITQEEGELVEKALRGEAETEQKAEEPAASSDEGGEEETPATNPEENEEEKTKETPPEEGGEEASTEEPAEEEKETEQKEEEKPFDSDQGKKEEEAAPEKAEKEAKEEDKEEKTTSSEEGGEE